MIYCYHKPLDKMTVKELTSLNNMPVKGSDNKVISKKDIIKSIRQMTLNSTNTKISTVCVKHQSITVYTDVVNKIHYQANILFESVCADYGEGYSYSKRGEEKIYLHYVPNRDGMFLYRLDLNEPYKVCQGDFNILLLQLRKINLFLQIREQHVKLKLLNDYMINDVVKYTSTLFITHYQIYNIIVK